MKLLVLMFAMLFSGIAYSDTSDPRINITDDPPLADFDVSCVDTYNGRAECSFDAFPVSCYRLWANVCEYDWYLGGLGYYTRVSLTEDSVSWSYKTQGFYDAILIVTNGINQSSNVTKRVWAGDPLENPEIRNIHISGEKYKGVVEVVITYETRFYDGGGDDKFFRVYLDGEPYDREFNNGTYVDVWDHNRKSAEYTICRRDYPDLCASVYGELQGNTVVEVDRDNE